MIYGSVCSGIEAADLISVGFASDRHLQPHDEEETLP